MDEEGKPASASGLITIIPLGSRKLYRANRKSSVFEELHRLIFKTVGLSISLREALIPFADSIYVAFCRFLQEPLVSGCAAFAYGSTAKGNDSAESDIDLMVIGGKLSYPDILVALQLVEEDQPSPSLIDSGVTSG